MSDPIGLPDYNLGWGPTPDAPDGHITLTGDQEFFNTPIYLIRGTQPDTGTLIGVVVVHGDGAPCQTTTYRADGTYLPGDGDLKAALHRLAGICPTCDGTGGDHQIGCREVQP